MIDQSSKVVCMSTKALSHLTMIDPNLGTQTTTPGIDARAGALIIIIDTAVHVISLHSYGHGECRVFCLHIMVCLRVN